MPELRISDIPGAAGATGRRVEVTWQDDRARRVAVAEFGLPADRSDSELLRWYLEDYAEAPAAPAPALAASAERVLADAGAELFRQVFSSPDAAGIWERARDQLDEVRVEVDADPGDGPGLAWELLRDPALDAPVALGAGSFVRTHVRAAGHSRLPAPTGDRLRVLLVICRPGGRDDVPFRSVASRLVRGGADQMPGLDLDVLRPATFARLAEVLRAASAAGRPYHVVHFDGHGDYLDVANLDLRGDGERTGGAGGPGLSPLRYGISVAGPVRPGRHGYLLFEAPPGAQVPGGLENTQLVDGPTLGRLLTETQVPVLVLNACRSAYAEAQSQPLGAGGAPEGEDSAGDRLTGDVHARIRAYGSLAAEIADIGVPGVVAMRYNVYVVTAAQFMADLYAHLLAGRPLGEAATAARRALAADPTRQIGAVPVALQDWAVPLVYEAAPLVLLRSAEGDAPVIHLTPGEPAQAEAGVAPDGLPRPPDAGFFGRDETLLALDRAFDTQRTVLLHAYAGAGKSTTAAEFGRWYKVTGGLDHLRLEQPGPVLWSSFERHLTADQLIGQAGDTFAPLIEPAYGKAWAAITGPAERRHIVLQVLAQLPVLWVWDNVEPVSGFPAGTASTWTAAEQTELADLLRDLAQHTSCKVLLTSRRDERGWLGDLLARVRLPPMPMRESLQLAAAIGARQGRTVGPEWRPLLRFAAGNPLTITVVTGQALRENLTTGEQLAAFVDRLRAGEAAPESSQDAELGRTRSLAASLDYGFAQAFTDAERSQLAALHLFRDTVNADVLRLMGDPAATKEDALSELARLELASCTDLLDRAVDIGLLTPIGASVYAIHPALPWYFSSLFSKVYGQEGDAAVRRANRAYARASALLGLQCFRQSEEGSITQVLGTLAAEEGNLLHSTEIGRTEKLWRQMVDCMQGLYTLYGITGRHNEWARLVATIAPAVTDTSTGEALPGRESQWEVIAGYRARIAEQALDWPTATSLCRSLIAAQGKQAEIALTTATDHLTSQQRTQIRNYGTQLAHYGRMLTETDDPRCLSYLQESLALAERLGDTNWQAQMTGSLGNAYMRVPELRDLDEAERWFRRSLSLRPERDRVGRARSLGSLAKVAENRFLVAATQAEPKSVLLKHINEALRDTLAALELFPSDDHVSRAICEDGIGTVYLFAGDMVNALSHYQRAIRHFEVQGNVYGAGQTRYSVALLLRNADRLSDALHYAHAALDNFRHVGPGAAADTADAESLIAQLEQALA